MVHGDDFSALGEAEDLTWYEDNIKKYFEVGDLQRLGTQEGCVRQVRILNRILTLTDAGLEYEADPRHTELLVRSLGLTDCRFISTPGWKKPFKDD